MVPAKGLGAGIGPALEGALEYAFVVSPKRKRAISLWDMTLRNVRVGARLLLLPEDPPQEHRGSDRQQKGEQEA